MPPSERLSAGGIAVGKCLSRCGQGRRGAEIAIPSRLCAHTRPSHGRTGRGAPLARVMGRKVGGWRRGSSPHIREGPLSDTPLEVRRHAFGAFPFRPPQAATGGSIAGGALKTPPVKEKSFLQFEL